MEKINPLLYITDTDPVPEEILDASGWYETEYMEIEQGEKAEGFLAWFLAQGWVLYDQNTSSVVTGQFWKWDGTSSPPDFNSHPSFDAIGYETWSKTEYTVLGSTSFSGRWYNSTSANLVYRLKRRKLQSERVLGDMISQFTGAYNEGRSINDQRYDELVSLYAVMVSNTEDELNTILAESQDSSTGYEALIEAVIGLLTTDYTTHAADVTGDLDTWGTSMIAEINTRFNNLVTALRQDLVTKGLYNTTVWTTSNSGIEKDRSTALTDLNDKIVDKQLALKDRIHVFQVDMRQNVMEAYFRLMKANQDNLFTPLEFRNRMMTAMLAFMERRTDGYPNLGDIANIAGSLGFAEGATVAPTT